MIATRQLIPVRFIEQVLQALKQGGIVDSLRGAQGGYYLKKVDVEKVARVFNLFGLYNLSRNKFYIDKVYNTIIYKPFFNQTKIASFIDWDIYDQKIIDAWGWITLKISNFSGKADYSILDQKIIDGVSHLTNYSFSLMPKSIFCLILSFKFSSASSKFKI